MRENQFSDENLPKTKRKWLKRIAAVLLLLIVGIVAAHGIWLWRTASALEARLNALTALGDPAKPEALALKVPDGQVNGFDELLSALAIAHVETEASERLDNYPDVPMNPLTTFERNLLRTVAEERKAAMAMIEVAVSRPAMVNTQKITSPMMDMQRPEMTQLRSGAHSVQWAAVLAFDEGRHDVALQRLAWLDRLAEATGSQTLVAHLISGGIRALQVETLLAMAPDLRIGTQPGEARPEAVRALISTLLREDLIQEELLRANKGERVSTLDTIMAMEQSNYSVGKKNGVAARWFHGYFMRPIYRSNGLKAVNLFTDHIACLDAPDYAAFLVKMKPTARQHYELRQQALNYPLMVAMPSLNRTVEQSYRSRTERAEAATVLAIRLYQLDHAGERPAEMQALVPKYLPALPPDRMAAGPLKYDVERGIIWSVGTDGIDNNGDTAVRHSVRKKEPDEWDKYDRVVHLDRQPRKFSEETQHELNLKLDEPIESLPPGQTAATRPTSMPEVEPIGTPRATEFKTLRVYRLDGRLPEFKIRRQVYELISQAWPAETIDPAREDKPVMQGDLTTSDGTWTFWIHANKDIVVQDPQGGLTHGTAPALGERE